MSTPKRLDPPSRDDFEEDPFERITTRLSGLQAVCQLAPDALNGSGPPSERVWEQLWYFVAKTLDDIAQDAELLRQERFGRRADER